MPRKKIDRGTIFRLMALGWNKKQIKRKLKISERTYWRIKEEFDRLGDAEIQTIRKLASEEEKAKEKFIDYELVQHWVVRMKSGTKPIKSWRVRFNACRRIWMILQKKNPKNWTIDDIELRVLPELRKTCKRGVNTYLVALRSLRPDFKFPNKKGDVIGTEPKPQPTFEWKYVYERMMQQDKLETFFKVGGFKRELLKRLHVTEGCREGSTGVGGILGNEWDRINWKNKTIDVFEGKTGGGFYWLNCPLDLFGDRTFEMLQQYWIEQGKPTSGKIFPNVQYTRHGHTKGEFLTEIYKEASEAIGEEYGRKGITPHFARKLHACLLIDADVPLEMVAGDKPFGIMGVGWEDLSTLKKYYLAFRKSKIEENRQKAKQLNI